MLVFIVISVFLFFFKQKTAYEMRISDWSSDVCSSDLPTDSETTLDLVHLRLLCAVEFKVMVKQGVKFIFDWCRRGNERAANKRTRYRCEKGDNRDEQ